MGGEKSNTYLKNIFDMLELGLLSVVHLWAMATLAHRIIIHMVPLIAMALLHLVGVLKVVPLWSSATLVQRISINMVPLVAMALVKDLIRKNPLFALAFLVEDGRGWASLGILSILIVDLAPRLVIPLAAQRSPSI